MFAPFFAKFVAMDWKDFFIFVLEAVYCCDAFLWCNLEPLFLAPSSELWPYNRASVLAPKVEFIV